MRHKLRNITAAAVATATIALPVVPATPAAAQDADCRIMGPYYVEDAVDCVMWLLIPLIDWPPR